MNDESDNLPTDNHPTWIRAKGAEFWFGVKRDTLNSWVIPQPGKLRVIAKKSVKSVIYNFDSIANYINSLPDFVPGKKGTI